MIKFLMKFFRKTDIYSGLNLYSLGRFSYLKLVDAANLIFRFTDRIRLFFYRSRVPIKLHLGCGDQRKDGYLNIDWRKTDATDFVCNISSIPLKDDSVSVIESYHVIEHLSERQAISTLENWYKMLDIGGKLVIECPNFDKAVKEYLDGNTNRIWV